MGKGISAKHFAIRQYIIDNVLSKPGKAARKVVADIVGVPTERLFPAIPSACAETAPAVMNRFSDGGLSNPTQNEIQVGGTGLWCPG